MGSPRYIFGGDKWVPSPFTVTLPSHGHSACAWLGGYSRTHPHKPESPPNSPAHRPWNASQWTAVDDRVRGGSSTSHLTMTDIAGPCDPPSSNTTLPFHRQQALFHGHLDITTLGGAGFASQRTVFSPSGIDLSDHGALAIEIDTFDSKTYTLILKDTKPLPRRPDGREQSTVSWEHDFCLLGSGSGSAVMRLEDFKPTYRGRPKPDAEPLNLKNITSLSIMMRSHFGEQEGDFALAMRSIAAYRHGDKMEADSSDSTAT